MPLYVGIHRSLSQRCALGYIAGDPDCNHFEQNSSRLSWHRSGQEGDLADVCSDHGSFLDWVWQQAIADTDTVRRSVPAKVLTNTCTENQHQSPLYPSVQQGHVIHINRARDAGCLSMQSALHTLKPLCVLVVVMSNQCDFAEIVDILSHGGSITEQNMLSPALHHWRRGSQEVELLNSSMCTSHVMWNTILFWNLSIMSHVLTKDWMQVLVMLSIQQLGHLSVLFHFGRIWTLTPALFAICLMATNEIHNTVAAQDLGHAGNISPAIWTLCSCSPCSGSVATHWMKPMSPIYPISSFEPAVYCVSDASDRLTAVQVQKQAYQWMVAKPSIGQNFMQRWNQISVKVLERHTRRWWYSN